MSDMLTMIQTLGDQLRWSLGLDPVDLPPATDIVLAGMGGSGVAGDYLAAIAGEGPARVAVHKNYAPLPGWVGRTKPLVLAVSYSGNTEETLDVVDHARSRGLSVVTITTGGKLGQLSDSEGWPSVRVPTGLQPRAAIGYLVGAVVHVAAAVGAVDDPRSDLEEAALLADDALTEDSPAWEQAAKTAAALEGRIGIVYGGGPISGTVAGRWKTQINENAKMPAWSSLFPELDHNELVGWETMPSFTRQNLGVIALTDRSDHPRVEARLAHSAALTQDAVPWVAEIPSWGESRIARLISLTTVGDLTSWMMALDAGVDPVPVDTIEKLKKLLTEG